MNTLFNPPPKRETLGANVLSQIKELLLTGQVEPGEQLSLRSTAEALGVSMMPVREAVYQLVADQALEVAPNRSVRVPVMTAAQFHEITQIRLQVEGYAVEQATQHVTPALVGALRHINAELSARMDEGGGSLAQAILLNKSLHFSLYEAAGMPMLVKIIESLWLRIGPVLNYDLRAGSERTRNKTAVVHHTHLIDALEAGNAAGAAKALRQDIDSAYQHIVAKHYATP
ncbi:FCD domain-containing protein [Pusillimonas sp. TS35]|uniref:GntR family transcriptional regulator n=1 Tax=Paracandidimonas lactea TaxID=2895524 RepID=UPI00136C4950|nr:GntR family transcriptional regulator [Paracandidimonas lactea]MYN13411.1 FCD domain-containing protein [Pusillimonas sp. TS35]